MVRIGAAEKTSGPIDTQPALSPQPVIVNVQQNVIHQIVAPQKPQSEPTPPTRRPPSPRGYAQKMGRKSELHKCRTCNKEVKIPVLQVLQTKIQGMTMVTHWPGCCTVLSIGCCCFLTGILSGALNTSLMTPHVCIPFCCLPCFVRPI